MVLSGRNPEQVYRRVGAFRGGPGAVSTEPREVHGRGSSKEGRATLRGLPEYRDDPDIQEILIDPGKSPIMFDALMHPRRRGVLPGALLIDALRSG